MAFIAPIITSAVGALGLGATAASLVGNVATLAIGVGASLWVNSRSRKAKSAGPSGAQTETELGGDRPRVMLFGTVATGGHLIYTNSYGASNAHEQEVYVLADVECDSLVGIYVDGEEKTLVSKPTVGDEDARFWVNDRNNDNGDSTDDANHYGAKLEIRFYRGALSQVADQGLIDNATPAGRWTADHRGDGVCYVVVDKTYDADLFSGFPSFTFVVKGAKVYDPRLDTTAGGSGAQRFDDPTTWAWSENPALCLYTYQRGFWRGGKPFLGMCIPASDLPVDYTIAAANVCDESVTLLSGSEARYAVSAVASDDQQHATVIETLVNAMAGELYEQGGIFLPYAGAARSVVATITDDDLVLGAAVRVSRKRSRASLYNYLAGSITAPADGWQTKSVNPITSSANETADGERLSSSLALPQITSQPRGERILKVRYNQMRRQTVATVPLSLKHVGLEVGDWIRWNSARYGDRVYRIDRWQLTLNGAARQLGVTLTLQEISSDVYGWTALADQTPAIPAGTVGVGGALTRTVAGFSVSAGAAASPAGESIPTLVATWTPPADDTVTSVIVQYRIDGETGASQAVSSDPETGELVIYGVTGGQDYEARATITTDPPRGTSWTTWVSVTTALTTIPGEAVIPASLTNRIVSLEETGEQARREALKIALAAQNVGNVAAASINEAKAQAVSIGTAQAAALSSLAAEVAATYATITQVNELEASVGDIVANVGVSSVAAADQTGAVARWNLRLNATDGSGPVAEGGVTYEAIDIGGTTVVQEIHDVDRLFLRSGASRSTVFSMVDGIPRFLGKIVIDPDVGGNAEIIIRGP